MLKTRVYCVPSMVWNRRGGFLGSVAFTMRERYLDACPSGNKRILICNYLVFAAEATNFLLNIAVPTANQGVVALTAVEC